MLAHFDRINTLDEVERARRKRILQYAEHLPDLPGSWRLHVEVRTPTDLAREVLVREPLCLVDYLVLVHPETLDDVAEWYRGDALLAVAARVGRTRLIDNLPIVVGQ